MLKFSPGTLAGLWEFPSYILPDSNDSTAKSRKLAARRFVSGLFDCDDQALLPQLKYIGELGSVPWAFSHLKLNMHVHMFRLADRDAVSLAKDARPRRWATADDVEGETMGTGMRQCWKLVEETSV